MGTFKDFLLESDKDYKIAKKFPVGTRVQFVGAKDEPGVKIISPPVKPSEMRKGTVMRLSNAGLLLVKWDGGKRNSTVAPGTIKIIKD